MTITEAPTLTGAQAATLDRYWRAANYLSAGQIYLIDNPLLTEPLRPEHIKPRLLGHWGTSPGLNFIGAHLGRAMFDALFTSGRPVIFAYHGYPWLIHRLTYRRTGHAHIHVRGYEEEGTTTTPFDMVVMNDMDWFHPVMDVIDRVPGLNRTAAWLCQQMVDTRTRHWAWTCEHGEDLPEVRDWSWPHD